MLKWPFFSITIQRRFVHRWHSGRINEADQMFKDFHTLKTVSPKRVVAIVRFTTISGNFLANPFNILHKTEALVIQKD